jgi:hypothetical protein
VAFDGIIVGVNLYVEPLVNSNAVDGSTIWLTGTSLTVTAQTAETPFGAVQVMYAVPADRALIVPSWTETTEGLFELQLRVVLTLLSDIIG